ncbi:phytoene/squalene synthase family protein [Aestuariimicrobium sp. Y1814]|uniref:phytoene/squalene synthase family protein n=1 Tax=Aestuariimicrobium sp. Y1814 TaxID=3418742 RepID=UPI003DA705E2
MTGTALDLYTRAAQQAADQVITAYSTSFGTATRLLGPRHRQHIRNIYALVRVADELVDGVASEAGLTHRQQTAALEALVAEVHRAIACGYSCDLIVHAFAHSARLAGFGAELVDPFFESMRADLDVGQDSRTTTFTPHDHDSYVYGSAEVVGLMCLRVYLRDEQRTADELVVLEHGARQLGAAFQDINFLRDLADDTDRLGRAYLSEEPRLTTAGRDSCLARIRRQLADAEAALPLLPRDARAAVRSAAALFSALADRIAVTDVDDLYRRRVRVPDPIKAGLVLRSVTRTWQERR